MSSRSIEPPVGFYAFDVLSIGEREIVDLPWCARRTVIDDLDLAEKTDGVARPMIYSFEAGAMHRASAAVGAEGTASKRIDSPYRPGRSRNWQKVKHHLTATFTVVGWRPTTPGRPGGLMLADGGQAVGVAGGLSDNDQRDLVTLFRRFGRTHPTGAVTIPEHCVEAEVSFTSRTPTHGLLREATVLALRPS